MTSSIWSPGRQACPSVEGSVLRMTVDQGCDRRQAQPRKDSVMIASHFEGGTALKKPLSLYLTLRQHKLIERAATRRGVSKHLLVMAQLSAFLADLERQDLPPTAPG